MMWLRRKWAQLKCWLVADWLKAADLALERTRQQYEAQLGVFTGVEAPPPFVLEAARQLCATFEDRPGLSGEYKRHQVYAALLKQFPNVKKRLLGLAIEVVRCGG